MPEPSLQTAFEIKTQCDEISRQLLRWHWEQRPAAIRLRICSSISSSAGRKARIITTACRICPERPAGSSWIPPFVCGCCWTLSRKRPVPWTCWGRRRTPAPPPGVHAVRNARNEAAHAGSPEDAQEAARIYADAIDCLAEAYLDAAFTEAELTQYAREAQQYLTGEQAPAPRKRSTSNKSGQKSRSSAPKRSTAAKSDAKSRRTQPASRRSQKKRPARNWGLLLFLLAVALVGLWVRAAGMKP